MYICICRFWHNWSESNRVLQKAGDNALMVTIRMRMRMRIRMRMKTQEGDWDRKVGRDLKRRLTRRGERKWQMSSRLTQETSRKKWRETAKDYFKTFRGFLILRNTLKRNIIGKKISLRLTLKMLQKKWRRLAKDFFNKMLKTFWDFSSGILRTKVERKWVCREGQHNISRQKLFKKT